jgi:uncharacterized membrane protein
MASPRFAIARRATELATDLRQQRPLRVMISILIPVFVWTIGALVWLWPEDVASHIDQTQPDTAIPGMTTPKGTVTEINEIQCDNVGESATGENSRCATLMIEMEQGPEQGQTIEVSVNAAVYASGVSVGQEVRLNRTPINDGEGAYQFAEFTRTIPMGAIIAIAGLAFLAVTWKRGITSLVGWAISTWLVLAFLFPALIEGHQPIVVAAVAGIAMLMVLVYAIHGFTGKNTAALVSAIACLIVWAAIAGLVDWWAHLTGVAGTIGQVVAGAAPDMNLSAFFVCGSVLVAVGVLQELCSRVASVVWREYRARRSVTTIQFIQRCLRSTRDNASSMATSTILTIAGAAVPTLLLITVYQRPWWSSLLREQFSTIALLGLLALVAMAGAQILTIVICLAILRSESRSDSDTIGQTTVDRAGDELIDIIDDDPDDLTDPDDETDPDKAQ